jgi:hypothetical protein
LPQKIEALEQAQQALHDSMAEADYFKRDKDEIASDQSKLAEIDSNLEAGVFYNIERVAGGASFQH